MFEEEDKVREITVPRRLDHMIRALVKLPKNVTSAEMIAGSVWNLDDELIKEEFRKLVHKELRIEAEKIVLTKNSVFRRNTIADVSSPEFFHKFLEAAREHMPLILKTIKTIGCNYSQLKLNKQKKEETLDMAVLQSIGKKNIFYPIAIILLRNGPQ